MAPPGDLRSPCPLLLPPLPPSASLSTKPTAAAPTTVLKAKAACLGLALGR